MRELVRAPPLVRLPCLLVVLPLGGVAIAAAVERWGCHRSRVHRAPIYTVLAGRTTGRTTSRAAGRHGDGESRGV